MQSLAVVSGSVSVLLGVALAIALWYFKGKLRTAEALRMAAEEVARAQAVQIASLRAQLTKVVNEVEQYANAKHKQVEDLAGKVTNAAGAADLLNRV